MYVCLHFHFPVRNRGGSSEKLIFWFTERRDLKKDVRKSVLKHFNTEQVHIVFRKGAYHNLARKLEIF